MAQINKPTDYFSTNLWVADDSSPRSLTGFGHQPDLVWTKHRGSGSTNHTLTDSVRGGDKALSTPTNSAEDSGSHGIISSFDSDGITVVDGTNATYPRLTFNELDPFGSGGGNYVGWSWKAGGTASSNTDGSITSQVSANTTSGFSIVSYTGTGSTSGTVGHGLGVAPKMIITKNRSGANNWSVYHASLSTNNQITLNQTDGQNLPSPLMVTTVGASTYTLGSGRAEINTSGNNYIAYCFAEKKGFSRFGSYTGNGSTDGTFVYTGFKPAWVLLKNTTGDNWTLLDSTRDIDNPASARMLTNLNFAEASSNTIDFYSNGFKLLRTDAGENGSGVNYIYMAFAENPLVSTAGVPCTAR